MNTSFSTSVTVSYFELILGLTASPIGSNIIEVSRVLFILFL